ncbi:hypothetical protein EXP78_24730, partial [Salmonella enterica subsp. enterica serovar Give]|nr:hypothetical protein [Salmonella enterica]EBR8649559.1 hypothetical protein [Salmonella enterica subsp. enterica serovar Muenchen]ECD2012161.1 hypothetical protein [Salmonella enterica subsp. enterica serovar Give]ECG3828403.1 hypothetical protein [Salmonella enterica subsp. enterica serovar Give]EDE2468049.1 hypothetical protein [Salmonella enterica subsp. enterica serovar Muenchen]
MQFTVYSNTGKSAVYPLLLDVTSDIIGQLNRRIVIPLLPVEKYPGSTRPERLVPRERSEFCVTLKMLQRHHIIQ